MTIPDKIYKSLLLYAVLGAIAVSAVFTTVGLVALHLHYQEQAEEKLFVALNTRTYAVDQFLTRAADISLQITSRSKVRDYLEEYNNGEIKHARLVQLSSPIIADSLKMSGVIAGISRFDAKGHLVVQVGQLPGSSFTVPTNIDHQSVFLDPVVFADKTYLPVFTSIINRSGKRVGTDLVFFGTRTLQKIITDQSGLGKTAQTILAVTMSDSIRPLFPLRQHLDNGGGISPAVQPRSYARKGRLGSALSQSIAGQKGLLRPVSNERNFIAFAPVQANGWGLAIKIDAADLGAPEKHAFWIFGCMATVITASGILFMFLLIRPLTVDLKNEITERRVREKKLSLFRKQVDSSNDAILIISPEDGRFKEANDTAHSMLGYTREELLTLRVIDVDIDIPDFAKWKNFVEGLRVQNNLLFVTNLRHKDSSTFPVEINIKYLSDIDDDCLIAIVRNISERREAEARDRIKVEQLSALNTFAAQIAVSLSLQKFAERISQSMVGVTDADFAILYILRNEKLIPIKSYNRPPFSRQSGSEPHRVGKCLCGLAARGKPVYSDNIHTDPKCTLLECKDAGIRSFAALPLLKGSTIIGVLGIGTLAERRFSEEANFLEAMAGQIALGVQNARLYDKLNDHANHLDAQVKERTADLMSRNNELVRLNKLFVQRELYMVKLKERAKRLEQKLQDMGGKS